MLLVVGATGLLGGTITQRLLQQGKEVRILVRHDSPSIELAREGRATSPETLTSAGAQPVYGDLKDCASLDAACAGVQTVITTANSAVRGGEDNPQTVEMQGNRNLIDAAREAGVDHFIFVSAQMASPDSPSPFLAGKAQAEVHLKSSGMGYTILAPDIFMEVWIHMLIGMPVAAGQPVTVIGSGERVHSFISMDDVAAFAVAAVDNPRVMNRRFEIGGPEALSLRDAVRTYETILDREIPIHDIAPGEPAPGMHPNVAQVAASFDAFDSRIAMEEVGQLFGVQLTPLEEVARNMLAMTSTEG